MIPRYIMIYFSHTPFTIGHNITMAPDYLDIDYLRSLDVAPESFGLGFIQLKLSKTSKVNFWDVASLLTVDQEDFHTHPYDFTSTIIAGSITHETAIVTNETTITNENSKQPYGYLQFKTGCCPGSKAILDANIDLLSLGKTTLSVGSKYDFHHTMYHRVLKAYGITHVTKGKKVEEYAKIAIKTETKLSNAFANQLTTKECWERIEQIISPFLPAEFETHPGYHLTKIAKGQIGDVSKIVEECNELVDAAAQGANIMILHELSDIHGAMELYLNKHHPSLSITDLGVMSTITQRAFTNGRR